MKNVCGSTIDSIRVFSKSELIMPNVVTPNSDGLNDFFQIPGPSPAENLPTLIIMNRWGEQVYYSRGYNGEWPTDQEPVSSGTYYYELN